MYKFIVLEGIHGAGKTTIAKALAKKLQKLGYPALYYHFPDEKELFGKLIRHILTEKDVFHHREVTGLLYASFANRFHILNQNTEKIFVLDRHSVTTGLVFQKDIPRKVREEIYKFGIEALQKDGIMIYLDIDYETAKKRMEKRNGKLKKKGGVREKKSKDLFAMQEFEKLSKLYQDHLLCDVRKLNIKTLVVQNISNIQQTVKNIFHKLKIKR